MGNEEASKAVSTLARLVAEMRITHRELDKRLGWSGGLTNRVLRHRKDIRLGQLLSMLHAIGVEPLAFFRIAYGPEPLPARLLEHLSTGKAPLPPLRLPADMTEDTFKDLIKEAVLQALGEAQGA